MTTNNTITFEYEIAARITDEGQTIAYDIARGHDAFWDASGFDGLGQDDPAFLGATLYYITPNDADTDDWDFEPIRVAIAGDLTCAWTASGDFEAIPDTIDRDDLDAIIAWAVSR